MKVTKRSNIYLPMAAMILTAALAVTAEAQNRAPFKGAIQGHDTDSFTTLLVTASGTGIGTNVGQFSFTQEEAVNHNNGTATGCAHWVAANGDSANGDSFDTTITASGELTETPGVIRITEIHTIVGGTGRFAGAQGSFTVVRLANFVTLFFSARFHGTIIFPGEAH